VITVVYLPNPFKPSSRILKPFTPDEVKTLADLKEHFKIHNPADFIWAINGHHIEDSRLDTAELRAADYVAIVPKIRGGGGGGGKNVLGVVAALALVAFTGGAGGGLLGGFLGSQGGMLGLGLALYLGGSLLMGNQKTPTIDAPKYDGAFEGGHGWSVDNIRNRPGSPLPVTFGSIRTSGQLLQRWLYGGTHAGKWTQFLQLLLAAGEGQLDSITDIKVNDIPIGSISGASYEVKLGTNNQTAVSSVVSQIAEQLTFSSELPMSTTEWVTKAMSTPGTRITFEFVAPAGIYAVVMQTGANVGVSMWIRGQYREVGASTWVNMWPYYPNGERPLASFNARKPLYFKENFTPPDPTKLYEFRIQNYTWKYYDDTEWHGAYPTMPDNYQVTLNWLSLTSRTNRALTFPGTAIVTLSLPATENLSGGMPKVSWTQTRANIYAWNPTAGAYQQKPATNLAWMIYDIIHACRLQYNIQTSANQYVVYGEPAANIDYDTFNEWATYCATEVEGVARCVGNLLLDSAEQMWPAIQTIATSARGFIIQQAGAFKPVWDAPKTVSQIFTSGNIINGSVKGGFLSEKERATAIEASFLNEDNGFERDTLFVPSDDYNPMSLDNPTQIYFPGLTSSDVVYRACKHILRRNKYLRRTISFQADIDSIVAEIGDVIGVQSDITDWGVGGRIMGATTTKVVIDQAVSLSPEGSYTLLVRAGDGTLTRKAVDAVAEAITTTELSFTGDPWSSAPVRFELYAFGVTELETKPFTITGISRNSDLQATIEGIEYVAGVYSDDTDFPVIDYTAANAAISTLTVNADADTGKLAIAWSIPEDRDYSSSIVFLDGKPYGFFTSEQNSMDIDAVPGEYTITVIPISGNGRGGDPVEETVTLGSPTLSAVSNVSLSSLVKQQADGTNLIFITGDFTIPTLATSVLVEIGEGSSPTSWETVQDSRVDVVKYGPVEPDTLYTLRFTARNRYATATATEEDVVTTGDTIAPSAPTVSASGYLKVIKIDVELASPPSDLAGFEIWKNTTDNTGTATLAGYTAAVKGVASFVDQSPSYLSEMYYWAKSVDTWGNKSAFSASILPTYVSQILTGDITANQIIGKHFTTACNVGAAQNGVMFNCAGIQAWCDGVKTVDIPTSGSPTFSGTVCASAGEFSGTVCALCGKIGGWNINETCLYSCNVMMNSAGTIGTLNFISGHRGWRADCNGNAEFNNIRARGAVKTVVFEKDEISVVGGHALIRPAAIIASYDYAGFLDTAGNAALEECWDLLNDLLDSAETYVDDEFADYDDYAATEAAYYREIATALDYAVFTAGIAEADYTTGAMETYFGECWDLLNDLLDSSIAAPSFVAADYAAFVALDEEYFDYVAEAIDSPPAFEAMVSATDTAITLESADQFAVGDIVRIKDGLSSDYWGEITSIAGVIVSIEGKSGELFEFEAGQSLVNYGAAGKGGVLLDGQSPLIDVYTHDGEPWNGTDNHVRIGNLCGWGDINDNIYGLAMGNLACNYLRYDTRTGQLKMQGTVTIEDGSTGFRSLADRPTCLAEVNSTEGSKLSGIAAGATVGAVWGTNLTGIPATLGTPSGAGLFLSSTHLGYFCNPSWKTYMDCSGNFYLCGAGTHGLAWNSAAGTLTVVGTVCASAGEFSGTVCASAGVFNGTVCASAGVFNGTVCSCAGNIGGWTLANGCLAATNAIMYAGAANTARIQLGTGACAGGINSANAGTDILFWGGNTHANRATAPFRVTAAGALTATNATICGTVCASAGQLGCFSISSGLLCGTNISLWCGIHMTSSTCFSGLGSNRLLFCDGALQSYMLINCSRYQNCSDGGLCCSGTFGALGFDISRRTGATVNCSEISFSSTQGGSTAVSSPLLITMGGGTSCYAFCTNGRISVSGTVYPSDRNLKTDFEIASVLPALRKTPIAKWRYKDSNNYQFGPVAQDFNPAFQLVCDWQTNLTVTNLDGIALRGVQELDECVAYNNRRILDLEGKLACLTQELSLLKAA
jgi:hypothetical protein